jgi:hypothetical protein
MDITGIAFCDETLQMCSALTTTALTTNDMMWCQVHATYSTFKKCSESFKDSDLAQNAEALVFSAM